MDFLRQHPILGVLLCLWPGTWAYQAFTGLVSTTDQMEFLVKLGAAMGGLYSVYKFGLKPFWKHGKTAAVKLAEFGEVLPTLHRIENRQTMQYERHKALINDSATPHFEADETGAWIWCNDTYRRLVGSMSDECLGSGWVSAVADGEKFQVFQEWEAAVAQGRDFEKCFKLRTPKGRLTVCVKAYALRHSNGDLAGYFGSVDLEGHHVDGDLEPRAVVTTDTAQQVLLQRHAEPGPPSL